MQSYTLFTAADKDCKPTRTDLVAEEMPTRTPYKVDPDGDIILFTPDTLFIDVKKGAVPGNYARFLVSSRHLALASTYFKAMLRDCWAEGSTLSEKGSAEIPVKECKPEILLIILNLIHGRLRQVPRQLSLQQFTDIAVTTDFFQCHEAIEMAAGIWKEALQPLGLIPSIWDITNWIMIASVFDLRHILQQATKTAMQQGRGPLLTCNLPIPKAIKGVLANYGAWESLCSMIGELTIHEYRRYRPSQTRLHGWILTEYWIADF
jgi:hypothetical protein